MSGDLQRVDGLSSARFRVVREIGSGGMGVVYEVHDRERDRRVALKTVHSLKASDLLRLKKEFRALQDLEHPNLVRLGELFEHEGRWFFTMELVDGTSFVDYVRPGATRPAPIMADGDDPTLPPDPLGQGGAASGVLDEARLRAALGQLAEGLAALHENGRLHRDIKPANVLVTRDGRVVILDFGLVTGTTKEDQSTSMHLVGTAAYMSPEQAVGKVLGPAADWYSVGVLLYEALTGRLPFTGAPLQVMMRKQEQDPPPPSASWSEVPKDLDALCVDLMRFDPARRPKASAVLERLGASSPALRLGLTTRSSSVGESELVGREGELRVLREAFDETQRARKGLAVLVHGESGLGKTALVTHFTRALKEEVGDLVVLAGRCFERESVRYKAVDGIIDELSQYLSRLPPVEAAAMLPRAADLLGWVFPVLRRVDAIARAPRVHAQARIDPTEARVRLFAAMRELFGRIVDRRPLVLTIDDLQWADADSMALIGELLRPPEAPNLLLIATLRPPEREGPWVFEQFLRCDVRHQHLQRLSVASARELAICLLKEAPEEAMGKAESIAKESEGHPLFIHELVRHAVARGDVKVPLRLDDVLWDRALQLPAATREVLATVAVAGAPLSQSVLAQAQGMEPSALERCVSSLRVARFLNTAGKGGETVRPFHDRVREAVAAHLSDEDRRRIHENLAIAMEASGSVDAEQLADHWREAGDPFSASSYSVKAATSAENAFAFDHAAALYRRAIDLGVQNSGELHGLQLKLATALANAGRGFDAAQTYLAVAAKSPPVEALELKRRAAEQYLRAGHIDEGLGTVQQVLHEVGLPYPPTPKRALLALARRRVQIRLRGLRFRERHAGQISPEELARLDACWSIACSLSMVDTIRSADFNGRSLLLALKAGEPSRLVPALALEATFDMINRGHVGARVHKLLKLADRLAGQLKRPATQFWVTGPRGVMEHLQGNFKEALPYLARGEELARDGCTGSTWELDTMQIFNISCTYYLGEMAELARTVPRLVAEALDKGDLYIAANFSLGVPNVAWLVDDDVEQARRMAREAVGMWSQEALHLEHWHGMLGAAQTALYVGEPEAAFDELNQRWRDFEKAMMLRVQFTRVEAFHLRARLALAIACRRPARARAELLRIAEKNAKRLRREKRPWALAFATIIEAGVAASRGNAEQAVARLGEAVECFETSGMMMYVHAARRRQGELLGGDEGRRLIEAANAAMSGHRLRRPEAWTEMFAPGFG